MRVNYPGLKKMNDMTESMIQDMSALICRILDDADHLDHENYVDHGNHLDHGNHINQVNHKIKGKLLSQGAEGPIFYVMVEEEPRALKTWAVKFEENHVLGRCLDLDVYDTWGQSISRQELGYPRRKCYLCEDYAQHCVRARQHSEQEVIEYIEERYGEYREGK